MRALAVAGELRERELGRGRIGQPELEGLDGDARGDLAGLRSAHPVGDHEQRRARKQRVLVGPPLAPRVGPRVLLGYAQHVSCDRPSG